MAKPQPLMLGNKYHFTLTDDSPIAVTARRPLITPTDVADARQLALEQVGLSESELTDATADKHFAQAGVHSKADFEAWIQFSLEELAKDAVATQVQMTVLDKLADRLREAIPQDAIAQRAEEIIASYALDLKQRGGSLEETLAASGQSLDELRAMATQDAEVLLGHEYALQAFAGKRSLVVEEGELSALLELPEEVVSKYVAQAKQNGSYEALLREAALTKALQTAVLEAQVSIEEETPEQAQVRLEREHTMFEAQRAAAAAAAQQAADTNNDSDSPNSNGTSRPDLKLV